MNKKEKLTKKEILKKFIAVYLAAFSGLLFIFYLGYYCGSVYAEDDLFSDIADDMKIDKDAADWFHKEFFLDRLGSSLSPDDDYIFFNTENYEDKYNFIMSYYFCLGEAIAVKTNSEITWTASGDYFKVYYHGGQGRDGQTGINYNLNQSTYLKGSRLVFDLSSSTYRLYVIGSDGKETPYYIYRFNHDDGSFFGIRNFETNIEEIESLNKLQIVFTPKFEGEVNRALEGDSNYTAKSFSFQVINNTAHPYQYALGIFPEYISVSPSTFTGAAASANWLYMTQQYVISQDLTQKDYWSYNNNYTTLSKSTIWHPINSGNSDYGYINYSQVAIEANVKYRVVCVAFPCSEGQSSTYLKSSELFYDPAYLEGLEDYFDYTNQININSGHVVCDQIFYISDLSDVPYNPNDTWGSWQTPYESYEDYKEALYSYNDVVDADGKVISQGQNLWSDKNSYIHNISGGSSGSNRVPVEVSSDTSAFIQSSNGIVAFFGNVLTIFPPEITTILLFGVTAIVFVIILKFIRGNIYVSNDIQYY